MRSRRRTRRRRSRSRSRRRRRPSFCPCSGWHGSNGAPSGAAQSLTCTKLTCTKLTHLQELLLNNNALSELPEQVGTLCLLNTLDLRWNQFSVLPEFLLNLTALTSLEIAGNPLKSLPHELYEREKNPFSETLRYIRQVRSLPACTHTRICIYTYTHIIYICIWICTHTYIDI